MLLLLPGKPSAWGAPRCGAATQPPERRRRCRRAQGSLASGTFAAYSPVTREAEVCDVQPAAVEEEVEEEEEVAVEEQRDGMDVELEAAPVVQVAA